MSTPERSAAAQDQPSAAPAARQKITTFLTFNNQAGEAMHFYVSVFKRARIVSAAHYGGSPATPETIMTGTFEIDGQQFMVLNGGPHFKFAPGTSLFVHCETQEEVDELWEKLSAGGEKQPCGWLRDKFGVSWQIIPSILGKLLGDPDREKANRVLQAMLKMSKIESELLKQAYEQG